MSGPTDSPQHRGRASYLALFGLLLLMLLLQPLFSAGMVGRFLLDATFSTLLLVGAWVAARTPVMMWVALAIAVPGVALRWVVYAHPDGVLEFLAGVFLGIFCLYVAGLFIADVLRSDRIGRDHVYAASGAYILLGLTWACAYAVTAMVSPGAFAGTAERHFSEFLYLSFVTLTTLGYGDLAPAAPFARMLAILEAIVGQLYVAIFVARLVAVYSAGER